jgi:hypothetical protein
VEPAFGADIPSIRLFLFGAAFGALLHQRGVLPLHGSAVVTDRGAVIFAGVSGSGKTTLACAFHQKGYAVIADDICAIRTGAVPTVMPGIPWLMPWADTIDKFGIDSSGLQRARPQIAKYILPIEDFAGEPVAIRAIYILESTSSELSAPTPVEGLAKVETLARNLYRPQFVEQLKVEAVQFRQIVAIAQKTPVRIVQRPASGSAVSEVVEMIERDFSA